MTFSFSGDRPTILVIDDEKLIQRSIVRSLRRDYEFASASSADEGLREMESKDFDLVICDLMMPGFNGIQFLDQLEDERPDLAKKLVFMTGGALDIEVKRFIKKLDDEVLLKPFGMDELESFVATSLERVRSKCIGGSQRVH